MRSSVYRPITTITVATANILETRVHDASSTNINASSGAWVALGSGAALANTITKIQISSTVAEPLEIGTGANAGAAVRKIVLARGGGPIFLEFALAVGDKLWVRSLSSSSATEEFLTVNLLG